MNQSSSAACAAGAAAANVRADRTGERNPFAPPPSPHTLHLTLCARGVCLRVREGLGKLSTATRERDRIAGPGEGILVTSTLMLMPRTRIWFLSREHPLTLSPFPLSSSVHTARRARLSARACVPCSPHAHPSPRDRVHCCSQQGPDYW